MIPQSVLNSYELINTPNAYYGKLDPNDHVNLLINNTIRLWINIHLRNCFHKWTQHIRKINSMQSKFEELVLDLTLCSTKARQCFKRWKYFALLCTREKLFYKNKLHNKIKKWKFFLCDVNNKFMEQEALIAISKPQFDLIQLRHCFVVWAEYVSYEITLRKYENILNKSHKTRIMGIYFDTWQKTHKKTPIHSKNSDCLVSKNSNDCVVS